MATTTAGSEQAAPQVRRIRFEYPEDLDPVWNRRLPEFACAANSVSLLMPHAEPYVVRSVRAALPRLHEPLRTETEAYLRQEAQHHAQHHRFNAALRRRYPGTARVERLMARTFDRFSAKRSLAFNLAFAAGFETVAYSAARWTEHHLDEVFRGSDPVPATLFLWHLAEEVEHKTVAYDVYEQAGGGRLTYAAGMITSMLLLAVFCVLAMCSMLATDRRLLSPTTHFRLAKWSFSFVFELWPTMLVAALPGHHPRDLADPTFLTEWLRLYDPTTRTMPAWSLGVLDG